MMRIACIAAAFVLVLGAPGMQSGAGAYTETLQQSTPLLALPRSLGDSNAALDAARSLRMEIDALAMQAPGTVRDVQMNVRRVAFDLLFHGAAAPFESQAMVIAGLRMAAVRAELDQAISLPPAQTVNHKAVEEAMLRFIKGSTNGLEPLPSPEHPELSLAAIMLPLEQAVAILESRKPEPPPTAWPAPSALVHIPAQPTRNADTTLAEATWIDTETRQALITAFERARSAGDTTSMQAINECLRAIEAGSRLDARPDGWTANAVCQGLRALADSFSSDHATRLADAVSSEAFCVAFDPSQLRTDLRAIATELRARAIKNGIRVAEGLPLIVRGGDPGADLAAQSLREDAADLARIGAIPGWVDAIGAARAQSRAAFESASKAWVTGLRDPARRAAIRSTMDACASEVDLLSAGRFERMVRRGDAIAVNACAGRSSEFLQEIDRRRSAWAGAWAIGKPSADASRRMLQAARIAEALEWSAALQRYEGAERQLNLWGGYAAPTDGWMPHPKAMAARSALALEAFLDGKDDDAEADIATVESDLPLIVLIARLTDTLEPWLATRNTLASRLVAIRDAPLSGAYLGSDREVLMQLARCLTEEARARTLRQDETFKELRATSSVICGTLARRLDGNMARITELQRLAAEIAARPAPSTGSTPKRR